MNDIAAIDQQSLLTESSNPKLFVIDARNAVERKHLLGWLHSTMPEGGPEAKLNWVSLSISDERRFLDLSSLAKKLDTEPDTLVVPVRVVWRIPHFDENRALKKRHLIFGNPRMPGSLRARFILLRDKRRAHCLMGKPATIGELRTNFSQKTAADDAVGEEEFAGFVARQAGLVLDIGERGLRGSRYKVPRFVADSLRTSPKFRRALKEYSGESGKPVGQLFQEARKYMKELIAIPSPLFIDLRSWMDGLFLNQGYEDEIVVAKDELDALRDTLRNHPTVLLFTHKTYIDGATPNAVLYRNDLPLAHTFGGINMAITGFSMLMRRSGIIFIRRTFQDNPVYKLTLRHYIAYLLEKRFPMAWALEGTRSRLGKLMPPRYGLLKYVMDAAHSEEIKDVHVIPVVTSFDLIKDVEEYALEQTGRVKKPESLKWMFGYIRSLREPMGRIYVDFGEPVVVKDAPGPDEGLEISKIAFETAVQANKVTPLTLTSLMCLCLLGAAPRAMTAGELREAIRVIVDWAAERNIRMSDDLQADKIETVQKIVDTLVDSGLFIRYDQGPETVYAIEPAKHPIASYYRNTIIHHFVNTAIIELSLAKARESEEENIPEVFWRETERLRDIFKFEFFYPAKDEFREELEKELDLVAPDWASKLEAGGKPLKELTMQFQPFVAHAVFLPFVEAYTIVFDILSRLQPGEQLNKNEVTEMALKESRQAYLLRRITSEASIGKILFENGFKLAANKELDGETTQEIIEQRRILQRKFRELSRRMEQLRLETLAITNKNID